MGSIGKTRSATIVKVVIDAMGRSGVDMAPILRAIGILPAEVELLEGWVPISRYNLLWELAYEQTGNDVLLGSRVARPLSQNIDHVARSAIEHSATLGDAIIRLSRLGRVLGSGFNVGLEVNGDVSLMREPNSDGIGLHYQATVCQLSTLGLIGRQLVGAEFRPRRIHLITAAPPDAGRLEGVFGCEICFESVHNAVELDSGVLCLPIRSRDAFRCLSNEEKAIALLRNLPDASFTNAVLDLMRSGVGHDGVSELASHIGLTSRTIARKLAAEGTSYQEVRDRMRAERARILLTTTELSTIEIGLSLGFSDGTAFSRAFKRWVGVSPSAFRSQQRRQTV